VPPGRSRGIGGCARAPCVFLAATEGTARGYGRVRGGKPVLSGGRPRGRNPRRRRGRHRSRKPAPGANERNCRYAHFLASVQTRCTTHAAALLAFVMSEALWALALRPEHHPRSDQSGHVASSQHAGHAARTRSAAGTFSGHRQRSRRICHQKCGCRLSPTTSGSSRYECLRGARARDRARRGAAFYLGVLIRFYGRDFRRGSRL
jgi:hypothetical protein